MSIGSDELDHGPCSRKVPLALVFSMATVANQMAIAAHTIKSFLMLKPLANRYRAKLTGAM